MALKLHAFWERNPALYYGLALLFGTLFVLETPWALLPLPLLMHKKFLYKALFLFTLPLILFYNFYAVPDLQTPADGLFTIHSVQHSTRYGGGWNYQGALKMEGKRIRCCCFSKIHYSENGIYRIQGFFKSRQGSCSVLKTTAPWECVRKRYTFIPWRLRAKQFVKDYIQKHVVQERAASFLTGMVTGELEDRVMKNAFSQLGLSHLMAISGLHFSLLALAFHLLFRLFLPAKAESVCLMAVLSGYLLFIGDTPSIVRAWIAIMVFLAGRVVERRSTALNSLGVALLFSLLWNPFAATTLSFQLSFVATGGILFFFTPIDRLLSQWLPKRALKEVVAKNKLWQHGYIFQSLFREALALSLAVHLAIFPLLLAYFHTFSLNSLFYNLFFPFLASLALLFFLAGLLLGHWAHVVNGYYCDWILQIPEAPPVFFKPIYFGELPSWLLAFFLTSLLILAIGCKVKKGAERLSINDQPLFNHL